MEDRELKNLLEIAINASIEAGKEICNVYNNEFDVEYKKDNSPLTKADLRSNKIILKYLSVTQIPVLSEEGKSIPYSERKEWEYFWIVDPLDGTKEFVKRNGEFTVNIALIHRNKPILGVIYIPVQKCLYFAGSGTGSIKTENINDNKFNYSIESLRKQGQILPLKKPNETFTIVGSKSHMTAETEAYINNLKETYGTIEVFSKGSSLKICMVAEGQADEYPRFAPTMEWDIAAGHAIVKYAGGKLLNYQTNAEFTYNSETLLNPWFIVKRKGL